MHLPVMILSRFISLTCERFFYLQLLTVVARSPYRDHKTIKIVSYILKKAYFAQIDLSRWMSHLPDYVLKRPITHIAIPGRLYWYRMIMNLLFPVFDF